MKRIKRAVAVLLVVLLLISCIGCTALVQVFENKDMRAKTEIMLDAILSEDVDTAYTVVDETCTKNVYFRNYRRKGER